MWAGVMKAVDSVFDHIEVTGSVWAKVKQSDISLILHTCDKYEFCWQGFLDYFNKYFRIDIPKYFCNEEKQLSNHTWYQFRSGNGEWSDRLKIILGAIPTKYVIYMQEDFWLQKKMEQEFFCECYKYFIDNDLNALYVANAFQATFNYREVDQLGECPVYAFDENSEMVEDEGKLLEISVLIENQRS
jgi:hypothetical protein